MSRGRTARRKGIVFERDVAQMLRSTFPGVRRQLEFQVQDAKGIDLQGCDPFKIQCKRTKKYVPLSTINEVQCDRAFGDVPVLIAAGDDQEPLACLPLPDFLRLVEAAHGGEKRLVVNCNRCFDQMMPEDAQVYRGSKYCKHCYKRLKTGA